MIVKDVMKKNVISVEPETTVTEAKELMNKNNISKLPVIKGGKLAGIITKNDLLQAGPSLATTLDMYEISYLLSKLNVKKIMTSEVVTASPDDVVEDAARVMVEKQIGCLPVVKNGVVVGIITENDLFRLFTDMFSGTEKGIRATLVFDDKPGQMACVSEKIAAEGGNIISAVTSVLPAKSKRLLTLKVADLDLPKLEKIFADLQIQVEDVRNI
ncbi:MAG: CBS domain-containing protein [Treponema sp.]|nr:CBS domain-containing protein [Treponema sp.]